VSAIGPDDTAGRGNDLDRRRQIAAGYDRAAAGYDRRHGDARSERRFAIIDAPQLAIARGAQRVLELGCGTGRLLAQTGAPVRVGLRVGIDISQAMLARAGERDLLVAAADAHALPFAPRSFDAVLAGKGVFRYLDPARAFAECARVLRPGGKLAVHQYAAHTWSPRDVFQLWRARRGSRPGDHRRHGHDMHVRSLDQLTEPARQAGLAPVATYLWRSVRLPPYALRVPVWMPGRLWSHCVVIFARLA
jgi:ubiquinone/menaquinone biosynthesis C-methylase UbiE